MKQIELAKKINFDQPYLSMILSGKRPMQWDLAKRLADVFDNDPGFWMDATPDQMNDVIKNNN